MLCADVHLLVQATCYFAMMSFIHACNFDRVNALPTTTAVTIILNANQFCRLCVPVLCRWGFSSVFRIPFSQIGSCVFRAYFLQSCAATPTIRISCAVSCQWYRRKPESVCSTTMTTRALRGIR